MNGGEDATRISRTEIDTKSVVVALKWDLGSSARTRIAPASDEKLWSRRDDEIPEPRVLFQQ